MATNRNNGNSFSLHDDDVHSSCRANQATAANKNNTINKPCDNGDIWQRASHRQQEALKGKRSSLASAKN
jgi:hypothetical protein